MKLPGPGGPENIEITERKGLCHHIHMCGLMSKNSWASVSFCPPLSGPPPLFSIGFNLAKGRPDDAIVYTIDVCIQCVWLHLKEGPLYSVEPVSNVPFAFS